MALQMIVYSVRQLLIVKSTCRTTRRNTCKPLITATYSLTCRSRTRRLARKIRIINLNFQIYKITLTLQVKIMISQRAFLNHSKLNSAIIWLRKIITKQIRRSVRITHRATTWKTYLRIKLRKCSRRASIHSKLIRKIVHTLRRIGRLTHLCALAWTKIMAFRFMIELVTWAKGQVT